MTAIKVSKAVCKMPPNTSPIMPGTEPVTAAPRPISAKTARSTASHGITARKKIAKMRSPQPFVSSSADASRAPCACLHRDRRRQDRQAHHQRNCHDERGNKSDRAGGERNVEVLQYAKKVEGKPSKDFKREQPSEEAAERRLAKRNGIGFCDLVKNDETMDGD